MSAAMTPRRPRRGWQWFPLGLIASMAVVFAVNGAMVTWALTTFPGAAPDDGYDISNRYDAVLERLAAQRALGWSVDVHLRGPRPELVLRDRDGAPLIGARATGAALRPLGPPHRHELHFTEVTAGHYLADIDLAEPGQWDLLVAVVHPDAHGQDQRWAQTQRVRAP